MSAEGTTTEVAVASDVNAVRKKIHYDFRRFGESPEQVAHSRFVIQRVFRQLDVEIAI